MVSAVAACPFEATARAHLELSAGDTLLNVQTHEDGWWYGTKNDGSAGYFPGSYVDIVEETFTPSALPGAVPPPALRFAFEGAASHEHATMHGLAAAYEGLFRMDERLLNGRPTWRHTIRPDRWIAYNGSGWMGQGESLLGTDRGVLLLRDKCQTPDLSGSVWLVTPGWAPLPGLRCIAMSEEEALRWEAESNPYAEAAEASFEFEAIAQQLKRMPLEELARMSPAEQLAHQREMLALRDKEEAVDARKIVRLAGGVIFLGEVDSKKRPHGDGELLLRDGSCHKGVFASGAAHGRGVYYDRKGSVHSGTWVTNFRVGSFAVVDPAGCEWADTYDDTGKRSARRCISPGEAAPPTTPAAACRRCAVRFHPERNFRCRRHKGVWQEATQKWLCCDARDADDPGCHFSRHELAA